MTIGVRNKAICPDCGTEVLCPTCGNTIDTMTPFSHWIRSLSYPLTSANYDNENIDYVWFHYRQGWLLTIEEKRNGGSQSPAQGDTQGIVAQLLSISSGNHVDTWRGKRPIFYKGHYLIKFSKTTPDDSDWILINGNLVAKDDVLTLLKTGSLIKP